MGCLRKNWLMISFIEEDMMVQLDRCCWTKPLKLIPVQEFFKIKDIIEYASNIECNLIQDKGLCPQKDCSEVEPLIKDVQINITKTCNLRCFDCFINNHIDSNISKKLRRFCFEKIKNHNLDSFMSTGSGEPFIYYFEFISYLKSITYNDTKVFYIFTNGLLLNEGRLLELKKISEQTGVKYNFIFSVDAVTEETYKKVRHSDFNKLLENIEITISIFSVNNVYCNFTIKEPNRNEALLYRPFFQEKYNIEGSHLWMNYDFLDPTGIDYQIYKTVPHP